MRGPVAALLCSLLSATVAASPSSSKSPTGSGAEVLWVEPQAGMLLDVAGGTAQTLSMGRARRVPARGYLAAQLRAGEPVWVHLDGDPQGESVRFSFLSGGAETTAAVEAIPERRAAGEFLFTAPLGPPTFLALSVKPGHTPPVAQFWVGTIKSPGYRWEL